MHTHCLPGARVLDVSKQIPAILKDDESIVAVAIHTGANDTKLRQTETLKRDFRSLIATVRSTSPTTTIIVSGPLPTYRRGHEWFSRLFALNKRLFSWCKEHTILFVNNWNLFWERPRLFRADGLHPSRVGASKPTTCLLDPVPTKLLKELLPIAEEPLLNIINSSLSLGHVPKPFKLAVIKPLIKKPKLDPCELANYRPISNLQFMSKILENVVPAQFCSFLLKKYIYEEFQSGFRPRHSTETALVKITNDLLLAPDQGCILLLVLLDLSAAFDTIDHDILIDQLQNYTGIQG